MDRKNKRAIGTFALVMINFVAIANVRSLPAIAPYGLSMLVFYLLATVAFLIPTALVSAELASGFPGDGGIYHWVSRAFGKDTGLLAVWLQNANNFICFPASLSFIASTLAYGIFPNLADNTAFTLTIVLSIIWGGTLLTMNGVKLTGLVSSVGGILGTLLPVLLIVIFCIVWLISGKPLEIELSWTALKPNISGASSVALFSGVLLGFAGLEMSANHVQDVYNPQKKYPRAIFLSSALILFVSILGTLGIAMVIPPNDILMNAGAIQALSKFLSEFGLSQWAPILSWAIVLGTVAWFCAWVSGPPRSLHAAAKNGDLPKFFNKVNKHNMPVNIMIAQAVMASALSIVFMLAESINAAFWMLTVMTSQLTLLMYILLFLAGIILKFKCPDVQRAYQVPFGRVGMCCVAGAAMIICLLFYIIGYYPPDNIGISNKINYVMTIFSGNILIGLLPYLLMRAYKKYNH